MDKQDIINWATDFVEHSPDNIISRQIALTETVVGMKIFEPPIFAFGNADDEKFRLLQEPSAIGKHFLLPTEWLPQAKTVISYFLPFTEAVKKGNRRNKSWPSEEWLHARVEGQAFVNKLSRYLKSELVNEGYNSLVPAMDQRFWAREGNNDTSENYNSLLFTSNWSERHVAFVCGLGTFGLSKGIITEKGTAGRLGSIITELHLYPSIRKYRSIYEYCSNCGKCVSNCPVNAISIAEGKNHNICSKFLDKIARKFKPRYGCGKCQVGVPCESRIPGTGDAETCRL